MPRDSEWRPLLAGQFVFLSAGWPGRSRDRPPEVALLIDEAVESLVRAVAVEGGSIAMVEEPAFSSLVAFLVGEYRAPPRVEGQEEMRHAQPSVWVYRERSEGRGEHDLHEELGHLRVHSGSFEAFLRQTKPRAMVCIGGGEELARQYALFRLVQPEGKIFVLATTGGMAAELRRRESERVRAIDTEIQEHLALEPPPRTEQTEEDEVEPDLIPYPLIMQQLVHALTMEGPEPEPMQMGEPQPA